VYVHGVYASMEEAQGAVRVAMEQQPSVQAFVVEDAGRWVPVQAPERGTGVSEEEIAVDENENSTMGRMGSVCEVRKSTGGGGASAPAEKKSRGSTNAEVNEQQRQLDELVRAPVPGAIRSAEEYAALRERCASLRAFERHLGRLCEDAATLCERTGREARELGERHPEYGEQYRGNYMRALRESGLKPEDVPFMQYLDACA
jgi:hypothetical protein